MKSRQKPAERAKKLKKRARRVGQNRRHEVTGGQWEFRGPLIPRHAARTGRKPKDSRFMLNGVL